MTDSISRTDEPSSEALMLHYLFGFTGSQAIAVAAVFTDGGCQRTEAEFRGLLRDARFAVTRVIPTGVEPSIIESQPV
jgi:hypothetical protein